MKNLISKIIILIRKVNISLKQEGVWNSICKILKYRKKSEQEVNQGNKDDGEHFFDYSSRKQVTVIVKGGKEISGFDKNEHELPKIVIQVHIYFLDLLDEVIESLNNIPYRFDCFVSTDSEEKKAYISKVFMESCNANETIVEVFANKGRDVAPFLQQMHSVIQNYKYVCHIHTKKAETVSIGSAWRKYLFHNLLGSKEYLLSLFESFEKKEQLGLALPEVYPLLRNIATWSGTKDEVAKVLSSLELYPKLPDEPLFPAGNMFWARTKAIAPLFEIGYTDVDFPDEEGQVNFTLAHVIERIWISLISARGYDYKVFYNAVPQRIVKAKKTLVLYIHCGEDNKITEQDMVSLSTLADASDELVFITQTLLADKEIEKVSMLANTVFNCSNKSDFACWKECIFNFGFENIIHFEKIILANNSCLGPINDLATMFNKMDTVGADFWSITSQSTIVGNPLICKEHIQSYFLVFERQVIISDIFKEFWETYNVKESVSANICHDEILLQEVLERHQFKYAVYIEESIVIREWLQTNQPQNELGYEFAILGTPYLQKDTKTYMNKNERDALIKFLEQMPNGEILAKYYLE